jgi:hypothetical protein
MMKPAKHTISRFYAETFPDWSVGAVHRIDVAAIEAARRG